MKIRHIQRVSNATMRSAGRVLPIILIACVVLSLTGLGGSNAEPVQSHRDVKVMTRNVDEGTDLTFVLAATTFDELLTAVADTYLEVAASNIPERAAALAREIRDEQPDLVGLQEVSIWRVGPGFDPKPARKVAFDPLEVLLDELDKLGMHYAPVGIVVNLDFELPSALGIDVRRTDRGVLLARTNTGLALTDVQTRHFDTQLPIDSPLLGQFSIPTGWVSVDAKIRGKEFRLITTHLDNLEPAVRNGQAFELTQGPANTDLPVVVIGDFNSDAESSDPDQNGAYQLLLSAGFIDVWDLLHPGDPGYTWPLHGHDPFIPFLTPTQRIDLVLTRDVVGALEVALIGESLEDLTPSGLSPSDHAGVLATLRIR